MASPIIAIIHAPDASHWRIREIWDLLMADAGRRCSALKKVLINPACESLGGPEEEREPCQLIIVWGMDGPANWPSLISRYCGGKGIERLVAIDWSTLGIISDDHQSQALHVESVSPATKSSKCVMENFLAGYFTSSKAPYGYKKVTMAGDRPKDVSGHRCSKGPFILEPGDPDQVAMARYIFETFSQDALSRMQLVHALNAQRVAPLPPATSWNQVFLTRMLSDSTYIGASRYGGLVRYNVFPPIIPKAIFFGAQTRLAMENWRNRHLLEEHPESSAHSDHE